MMRKLDLFYLSIVTASVGLFSLSVSVGSTYDNLEYLAGAPGDVFVFCRGGSRVLSVIDSLYASSISYECDIGLAFRCDGILTSTCRMSRIMILSTTSIEKKKHT